MSATVFKVYGIHPKDYDGEIAGGDKEWLFETIYQRRAFAKAKKESKKSNWHEVTVYSEDFQGEIEGHWYFAKGKLKLTMAV